MSLLKNKTLIVILTLIVISMIFVGSAHKSAAETQPTTTTTTTIVDSGSRLPPKVKLGIVEKRAADILKWNQALKRAQIKRYIDAVLWSRFVAHLKAEKAREAARRAAAAYPHGLCGGDLPPCWIMMKESRGNIRAENPTSTASGKWQFIDRTWAGFGGYSHASYAPEKVQDAKARLLWNHGRGCSHWSAC